MLIRLIGRPAPALLHEQGLLCVTGEKKLLVHTLEHWRGKQHRPQRGGAEAPCHLLTAPGKKWWSAALCPVGGVFEAHCSPLTTPGQPMAEQAA